MLSKDGGGGLASLHACINHCMHPCMHAPLACFSCFGIGLQQCNVAVCSLVESGRWNEWRCGYRGRKRACGFPGGLEGLGRNEPRAGCSRSKPGGASRVSGSVPLGKPLPGRWQPAPPHSRRLSRLALRSLKGMGEGGTREAFGGAGGGTEIFGSPPPRSQVSEPPLCAFFFLCQLEHHKYAHIHTHNYVGSNSRVRVISEHVQSAFLALPSGCSLSLGALNERASLPLPPAGLRPPRTSL